MTHRVIYLAGPYTAADERGRRKNYRALTEAAADLIGRGHIVFSPITHSHPIDVILIQREVRLSSDYWCDVDETFMAVCTEMAILNLPGWDESSGIRRERAYFERRGLPVWLLDETGEVPEL